MPGTVLSCWDLTRWRSGNGQPAYKGYQQRPFFFVDAPLGWEETAPFDPEQPFQQGFSTSVLRSLLNEARDALEDHFEITGNIVPDDVKGDRRGLRSRQIEGGLG